MSTVLITGGTGLVGTALSSLLLAQGHQVILMGRKKPGSVESLAGPGVRYAIWDTDNQTIEEEAIKQADYIIQLAGAGIADKRWSERRKKEIVSSRTKSCSLVVKSLAEIPNAVRAVISASAIGWYGPDKSIPSAEPFIESDPPDKSFLGETTRLWEESIGQVEALGKRLVILRTGIVLSRKGGAMQAFKNPVKFGIAAILGNGKQVISWIHIDDLCRIFCEAITNEALHGVYNAVAPNPVSNKKFTLELANMLKGRFFIPVHIPVFVLKIILGELSIEVLKSATVSAAKIREEARFQFIFPSVPRALKDLTAV
jgi:uncharacterized protein (TIGR01777 family)